jgi:hypothetical protein
VSIRTVGRVDDTAPLDGFGRRPAWINPFHDDPDTATSVTAADTEPSVDADEGPSATAPVSTPPERTT